MSDKKPVWVDESAHAILKQYSKLTKESMVDVASRLVLDHLDDLDPSSGLAGAEAKAPAPAPEAAKRPARAPQAPTPVQRPRVPKADGSNRFLGGVWFI